MPKDSIDALNFLKVISDVAEQFPYVCCPDAKEHFGLGEFLGGEQTIVGRILPEKVNWSVAEFLAFEGSDFVDAVTLSMLGRNPTAEERRSFNSEHRPWVRLAFLMEAYRTSRRSGNPMTIHGVKRVRSLWRTQRFFRRNGLKTLERLTALMFRRASSRLQREQMSQIVLIQLGRMVVERLDGQQVGASTH